MSVYSTTVPLADFPGEIDDKKAEAKRRVDAMASNARQRFVPLNGMGDLYAKKSAEAAEIAAAKKFDAAKDGASYPFLKAEAEARGVGMVELAKSVIARADETDLALATVEATRIKAKQKIDMAQDISDVLRVFAGIKWPMPA